MPAVAQPISECNAPATQAVLKAHWHGAHPRWRVTDEGKTLLVTDFDSDQIELLSVDQLPAQKDANIETVKH
jgi:hypothetical protein